MTLNIHLGEQHVTQLQRRIQKTQKENQRTGVGLVLGEHVVQAWQISGKL